MYSLINQNESRFKNVLTKSVQVLYDYELRFQKKFYLLHKDYPLLFATPAHLSFILSGRKTTDISDCPILCAKCKNEFTKDFSGKRFSCKGHNCNVR